VIEPAVIRCVDGQYEVDCPLCGHPIKVQSVEVEVATGGHHTEPVFDDFHEHVAAAHPDA
jgi:hypothetical protein